MLPSLGGSKGITYDTRLFRFYFIRGTNYKISIDSFANTSIDFFCAVHKVSYVVVFFLMA